MGASFISCKIGGSAIFRTQFESFLLNFNKIVQTEAADMRKMYLLPDLLK